jgi:TolB-like protein
MRNTRPVYVVSSLVALSAGFLCYYFFRDSNLIFYNIFNINITHNNFNLPHNLFLDFVRYNLCDGLWLLSGILLLRFIWFGSPRTAHYYIIIFMCIALLLEFLQIIKNFPGTFDRGDVFTMVIFALLEQCIHFFARRKQVKRTLTAAWGIAALALLCAGCATTVSFQVQRPPTLNTLGIQRLAVMPFTTMDNSPLQRQAAAWLTNESLTRIQATNHFTLINAAEVERARAVNGNVEALADALFGGQVVSLAVRNSSRELSYKDKEGNIVPYTLYEREVEMAFNYTLTRTRDGSMIGPVNKTVTTNEFNENPAELRTPEAMVQSLVQQGTAGLARDVAPYMATERRSLMNETSKDKAVKQRAKEAHALVKAGSYKSAQNAFLNIYQDTGSFPAGYNIALLIEVQGDLEGAVAFLQQVYNDTGNPQAAAEISRLQRAIANAGLLEAYKGNQSQRDKVIARMVETLPSAMPDNPRVALINNSQNEKETAEIIINGIIDGLVKKNITVVDRNNRALVEMERNYQYSGNVSDDEMVSLGHEAGVNAFVLVAITGSGGLRRLSVQMLDVERNTILYQSPQTDEMNL